MINGHPAWWGARFFLHNRQWVRRFILALLVLIVLLSLIRVSLPYAIKFLPALNNSNSTLLAPNDCSGNFSIIAGTQGKDIMGMFQSEMLPVLSTLATSSGVVFNEYEF